MKYGKIEIDPPWRYGDALGGTTAKVARGAASIYATMSAAEIMELAPLVGRVAAPAAVCALWIPDAIDLSDPGYGARWLVAAGFVPVQRWIWIKTTKGAPVVGPDADPPADLPLAFGMGRLTRTVHEIAIIGRRGPVYADQANRSERSVILAPATPHSQKPDDLKAKLDRLFPSYAGLELFARRRYAGWTTIGNECPGSEGIDIKDWLIEAAEEVNNG